MAAPGRQGARSIFRQLVPWQDLENSTRMWCVRRRCFWMRGYEATSITDVLAQNGITTASLYNAFGDKETLFRSALEHYIETGINARLQRFEALPPRQAIEAFFADIVQRSLTDPDRKGCMVVNTALELAPRDEQVRTVITAVFERVESFFLRCIRTGQSDGTINAALGPCNLARNLTAVLMGLRVLARACPEKALLEVRSHRCWRYSSRPADECRRGAFPGFTS